MLRAFSVRRESWGEIHYSYANDEFSASVARGVDLAPRSPIGIGWVLLGACNLKCIHCYGNSESLPKGILPASDCFRVVDRIVEAEVQRVVISGGEPLLHPSVFPVIHRLVGNHVSVVLGTNGSRISAANVDQLATCTRVEISLDAATEPAHNAIRPSRARSGNSWIDVLSALDLCLRAGVRVRVLTAVNSLNQSQLAEMAELLASVGVQDWAVSWTLPAGRALPVYRELRPDEQIVFQQLQIARLEHPDISIRYSNRSGDFNRYYCLILPDGQIGTEDLELGSKVCFGSILQHPISCFWHPDNFDFRQHTRKWIDQRIRAVQAA
jgi:MoaA/NifB/PqqE/SkfB family radical SAM enzyme